MKRILRKFGSRMVSSTKSRTADPIIEALGLAIASGEYPEGAALPTEPEMMDSFGVGRSAIREAVRAIAALGMVETAPRRGTIVSPRSGWHLLHPDTMRWIIKGRFHHQELLAAIDEARLIFEPSSAALVASRATRRQVITIETAYALMEEAAAAGNVSNAIEADRAFHLAILQATGNPILEAFDSAIDAVLGMLFSVTANHMDNFRENLGNHLSVLEAIRRGRPEDAAQAMRETISYTTKKMKEVGLIS